MKAGTWVIALTLTAAASMTGCTDTQMLANAEPELQRATAIAIGGNAVAPEQIRISDDGEVLEPVGTVHWHASAPTGEFACSALRGQVGYRQPVCVKK
jgi:hypothetical protein